MKIFTVRLDGGEGCCHDTLDAAMVTLRDLMQEDFDGLNASIEQSEITEKEHADIPEFTGW